MFGTKLFKQKGDTPEGQTVALDSEYYKVLKGIHEEQQKQNYVQAFMNVLQTDQSRWMHFWQNPGSFDLSISRYVHMLNSFMPDDCVSFLHIEKDKSALDMIYEIVSAVSNTLALMVHMVMLSTENIYNMRTKNKQTFAINRLDEKIDKMLTHYEDVVQATI